MGRQRTFTEPCESLPGEAWRPSGRYGDLVQASSMGRVRQFDFHAGAWFERKPRKHKSGYWMVNLIGAVSAQGVKVHHLVAEAWHGPRPRELDTAHKDGCKDNNAPSNLIYCTRKANANHKRAHGVWKCPAIVACERRPTLRAVRVRRVRSAVQCGVCGNPFIGKYNKQVLCSRACRNVKRAAAGAEAVRIKPSLPQGMTVAERIANLSRFGMKPDAIAKMVGCCTATVCRYLRRAGCDWGHLSTAQLTQRRKAVEARWARAK